MKRRLTACLAILAPLASEGATLLINEVILTSADDNRGVLALAENISEPSSAWYRDDNWGRWDIGWQGLGGGRVTIQTEPGETIESVEIYLEVGATGYAPWNFAFQRYGSNQNTQIWVSQNTDYGSSSLGWWVLDFQPDKRSPIYFDVQTSAGSFGAQYYAASTVPEPTSGLMMIVSGAAILMRRRRP
jgi:hypothetical protein